MTSTLSTHKNKSRICDVAKAYDAYYLGIRKQDQEVFNSPPGLAKIVFSKASDYNKKRNPPLLLHYKIPNATSSGFLDNFSQALENHFVANEVEKNEQLKIFGMAYFTVNIFRLLYRKKENMDFNELGPYTYVMPEHLGEGNGMFTPGITQDSIEANVTRGYLEKRYDVSLEPYMIKVPFFDGETSMFCHDIEQIINMVYLAQPGKKPIKF